MEFNAFLEDPSKEEEAELLDKIILEVMRDRNLKGKTAPKVLWPKETIIEPEGKTFRYPAPLLLLSEKRRKIHDDSYSEDSEIDEALEKKPNPSAPIEHSPFLHEFLEGHLESLSEGRMHPKIRRASSLHIMKTLQEVYEITRDAWQHLSGSSQGLMTSANGDFLLHVIHSMGLPPR